MVAISMVRAKCYSILQGLERSLRDNLLHHFDVEQSDFLVSEEQNRALNRLRDDMEESEWSLRDVTTDDLLSYLDLGDLIDLLDRHKSSVQNLQPSDIRTATQIIRSYKLLAIRKRIMHPVRPLEADDLPTLMLIARSLHVEAPNLIWKPMIEGVRLAQTSSGLFDVQIPTFWTEESSILHNLPPAEFDDSGFVGRSKERRQLKKLLDSDRSVITVVGAGGIGKTALALRVCHDILEDTNSDLERIVWVSLKTQHLTVDGIREVVSSVDSVDILVDRLLSNIDLPGLTSIEPKWDRVVEQMRANRTLLVIDNLETLGPQIRDLAIDIPHGSKLLLTSRIGLGEIELRYEMPDLSAKDAGALLRTLGVAYNYTSISELNDTLLKQYALQLHYNPLLIKWFVQAVGKGTRPEDVLSNEDFGQALRFCWENVYAGLSPLSTSIISSLLAARRGLSQAQLQELTGTSYIQHVESLQELHQSNVIETRLSGNGGAVYQIGNLVFDYLSRFHPPKDAVVKKTRAQLKQWQSEQDRSAIEQNTYRYGRNVIHIESIDERISATHLRSALSMLRYGDSAMAIEPLRRAQELTPQWSEVYRIKAFFLEKEGRPIYEIEQAFEDSISCRDTDVNRFHYAVYLLRIEEYERALAQIESAAKHESAEPVSITSVKGLVLLRSGRIPEALEALEFVWNSSWPGLPISIKRVHGTQFAGGLKRRVEQLYALGDIPAAHKAALEGAGVVHRAAEIAGWDWKLAEVGVQLLGEVVADLDETETVGAKLNLIAAAWDADERFTEACIGRRANQIQFRLKHELALRMPNTAKALVVEDHDRLFTGVVRLVNPHYGFIRSEELGDVHMNRSSLLRPSAWTKLKIGHRVAFAVRQEDRGPHALHLESDLESN